MLAVMLDKCHRLANPKSGISAAQIMQTAHGIPVDELTDEDMKHAASYKRTMKTLIETFRSNFKTLPPAEAETFADADTEAASRARKNRTQGHARATPPGKPYRAARLVAG